MRDRTLGEHWTSGIRGENYHQVAIESVLGQTYGDLELIITDNASTDATEDICRSYAARDDRVRHSGTLITWELRRTTTWRWS